MGAQLSFQASSGGYGTERLSKVRWSPVAEINELAVCGPLLSTPLLRLAREYEELSLTVSPVMMPLASMAFAGGVIGPPCHVR